MKRILVTGGAGFIGSHVAEVLIEAGHTVAVLDNLSSGRRENLPEESRFFEVDITDKEGLEKVFSGFKPEIVNHHAAQISVNRSVREPCFDAEQNILGTINLLEASARHGVKRFIFASTGGALYGDAEIIPSNEDTPVIPLAPYGIAKASAENYVRFFWNEHGIEPVVLRYANVYGPRQDPYGEAGVVGIFSLKALSGEGCVIYGTGEQTRDFVYVKDVARSNLAAVDGKPGTYNIGTGIETSINKLFSEFKRLEGSLKVSHDAARPGEVFRSVLDVSRAGNDLCWQPQVNLSDGIRQTYAWFKQRLG
ncbi:MAG: NAD-dependent epimerase/dehydratase family protein [candidate division WOR-3 bacterium]|nr:NAD-dependent epimerase/dehydratase family protein [candidate division WOR-3 bacterium]